MPSKLLRGLGVAIIAIFTLAPLAASATATNGQIYFLYQTSGPVDSIAAANPDTTESHIVVQGDANNSYFNPVVSPDGSKLVFEDSLSSGDGLLKIANADGTSVSTLYTPPGSDFADGVSFSPNGSTVYFALLNDATTATNGIYSVPATGGSATQLIPDTSTNTYGAPVASSSKLYVLKTTSSGTSEIDSANLNGSSVAALYAPGGHIIEELYGISPDGSKLIFGKLDGSSQVQLNTVDTATGSTVVALTALSNASVFDASYSPDGTKIIYDSSQGQAPLGGTIINADGTGATAFRADSEQSFWSSVAIAAPGTFPNPLPVISLSSQGGGSGSNAPSLPDSGGLTRQLPLALLIGGLTLVAAVEGGRRVLARR